MFKKKARKSIRQRIKSEDDSDTEPEVRYVTLDKNIYHVICLKLGIYRGTLDNLKQLQNLRKRPHGVNVIGLALGKKVTLEDEIVAVCDKLKNMFTIFLI